MASVARVVNIGLAFILLLFLLALSTRGGVAYRS